MAECDKCKHKKMYETVSVAGIPATEEAFVVKMVNGVYLETEAGTRFLTASERVKLPAQVLKNLLDSGNARFYFPAAIDRQLFLELFPEYSAWNL